MAAAADDHAARHPALWCSGFRPLFLAGCAWGLTVILAWVATHAAGLPLLVARPLVHAHEMIHGFAAAIAGGFILTALPGWAGTPAVAGRGLMLLTAAWGLGRLGLAAPPAVAAVLDLLYLPLLTALVAPGVWRARNRLYRLLLPVLALLIAGTAVFHLGMLDDAPALARLGNRLGLAGMMLLFSLIGGLLTPIFTATALGRPIPLRRPLEYAAVSSLALLLLADLAGGPGPLVAGLAVAAALLHALRMSTWRSAAILGQPLLAAMHLGHLWLAVALLVKAAEAAGLGPPASAAVHAFTLGAMGLTMLSLMTRVALKHTGRPLRVHPALVAGYGAMALAAPARLAAEFGPLAGSLLPLSAGLWLAAIALYLGLLGRLLLRPSLERQDRSH